MKVNFDNLKSLVQEYYGKKIDFLVKDHSLVWGINDVVFKTTLMSDGTISIVSFKK